MTDCVTDTNVGKMTEEEAIAELKKAQESNSLTEYPSNESLGVAIEALQFLQKFVTCKDCKHWDLSESYGFARMCEHWQDTMREYGYCYFGERRDEK